MSTAVATPAEIRSFTIEIPERTDRRPAPAHRGDALGPPRNSSTIARRACSLATIAGARGLLGERVRLRAVEARLNALPQFTTEIDGVEIHFIHVRSRHENALPLIMTHGWPGSVIELLETVGPLTDPTAHGGTRRGRIPPRAAVPARLRVLERAGRARLGRRPHRTRVGGADAPPRLHPLRRPGRRRGCPRHGPDGPPGGRRGWSATT